MRNLAEAYAAQNDSHIDNYEKNDEFEEEHQSWTRMTTKKPSTRKNNIMVPQPTPFLFPLFQPAPAEPGCHGIARPERLACAPSPWRTARLLRSGASPSTFAPGPAGRVMYCTYVLGHIVYLQSVAPLYEPRLVTN